jgi:large subunit ribosomal protein L6
MSRIGKKPVPVPAAVTAAVTGNTVKVKGPKGELSFTAPESLKVEKTAEGIEVTMREDTKSARAMWGMSRTMVANLVKGVTEGYSQVLEIHGVGFKASMKSKDQLTLSVGYSHDVVLAVPAGVDVKVGGAKQEIVTVTGTDRQAVGQMAAVIRASRKPEPYQGKGVRYQGEYIFRKEGKKK